MTNQYDDQSTLRRRDFLRILGGSMFALAAGGVAAGCGGGGSSGSNSISQTVTGTVNRKEIGGEGLTALSTYGSPTTIAADSSVTLPISASTAQIHPVVDTSGDLRAMTITTPVTKAETPALQFNAASSAVALIFLTTNILSSDPTAAIYRMRKIRGLTTFTPLVNFLAKNLPTQSLKQLRANTDLQSLIAACLQEYGNLGSSQQDQSRVQGAAGFSAAFGPGPIYPVNFTNAVRRWVSVVQQNFDATEVSPPRITSVPIGQPKKLIFNKGLISSATGLLDGMSTVSPGTGIFNISGNPGQGTLTLDLQNPSGIAAVRLWAIGPGNPALSQQQAPDDVAAAADFATACVECALLCLRSLPRSRGRRAWGAVGKDGQRGG